MLTKINFTKIFPQIESSKKLNSSDKLFISKILSFQDNNLEFFASTSTIADTLGMSKIGVKKMLERLVEYQWFDKKNSSIKNENNKYENKRYITIDEKSLEIWLSEKEEVTSTIEPEVVPVPQAEEKVPVIEEKPSIEEFYKQEPIAPQNNNENKIIFDTMTTKQLKEKYNKFKTNDGKINYQYFREITKNYFISLGYLKVNELIETITNEDELVQVVKKLIKIKQEQEILVESK